MNYFGIIKKAYHLTLKHRFLWIFGILAGSYGGFRGYNFSGGDFVNPSSSDFGQFDLSSFWSQYGGIVISVAVLIAVIFLILFVLSIISQGALISSVAKLDSGSKTDFSEGFHVGWSKFWRVLGTMAIYVLVIMAAMLLWITPTALFAAILSVPFAVIWGILFLMIMIVFMILVAVISPYSIRAVVLKSKSVTESISDSLQLCRKNLADVVVMYLILLAIGIGFAIAALVVCILIGALLVGIGAVTFMLSGVFGIFYSIIVGALFFGALIVLAGAYGAFSSAVLTLTYKELTK